MTNASYAPVDESEVTRLVTEFPFAWVVTAADGDFAASLLPIRPAHDATGRLSAPHGHFARRNRQVALGRRHP